VFAPLSSTVLVQVEHVNSGALPGGGIFVRVEGCCARAKPKLTHNCDQKRCKLFVLSHDLFTSSLDCYTADYCRHAARSQFALRRLGRLILFALRYNAQDHPAFSKGRYWRRVDVSGG